MFTGHHRCFHVRLKPDQRCFSYPQRLIIPSVSGHLRIDKLHPKQLVFEQFANDTQLVSRQFDMKFCRH